jgi:hypothetical protein
MPFFRDIKTLKQQAREIDRAFDPGSQMRAARERMARAQEVLARHTAEAVPAGASGARRSSRSDGNQCGT